MDNKSKKKSWNEKFLFIIYDPSSLEELNKFRLSKRTIYSYVGLAVLVLAIVFFMLYKFTPLRILIGYDSDPRIQQAIIQNIERMDSLEEQMRIRDQYYKNFKKIIRGEIPQDSSSMQIADTAMYENGNVDFAKSKHDSILRKQIEEEEQLHLSMVDGENGQSGSLQSMHFFAPMKGVITNSFKAEEEHYGIDIVSEPNTPILATLSGTVVYAGWTLETGHVIQLQHQNNLLSFYKHNSSLLKKTGDHVKAGETIAIVGNSGEQTSGPHLHFEIWHNGVALDPHNYIVFQ